MQVRLLVNSNNIFHSDITQPENSSPTLDLIVLLPYLKLSSPGWVFWHMPLITELESSREEDREFLVSRGYIVNSKAAWATE
jgi:hypothetical protein